MIITITIQYTEIVIITSFMVEIPMIILTESVVIIYWLAVVAMIKL